MNRSVRLCTLLLGLCILLNFCASPSFFAHAEAAGPEVSAKACILMDAQTGQVVYALNAEEKRPMASTTKIMTTLLTLESGGLDTPFPVDSQAIQVEGSSMGLQHAAAFRQRRSQCSSSRCRRRYLALSGHDERPRKTDRHDAHLLRLPLRSGCRRTRRFRA